jgi:hypothetical protein
MTAVRNMRLRAILLVETDGKLSLIAHEGFGH